MIGYKRAYNMKTQSFTKLKSIIQNFRNKKVLVIGDLILDEFIWGKVNRISPEAPVPVVWVDRESFYARRRGQCGQ
ncbi:MAG: hypothetical protein ABH885_05430 [Candidatus Omnitrophota bacterium]